MENKTNPQRERAGHEGESQTGGVAVDPVCGMDVDSADASTERSHWQGKTYYFCSSECRQEFESSPGEYTLERI